MNQITFKIDNKQLDSYVNRELTKQRNAIKITFGIIIVGFTILSILKFIGLF